MRAGHSKRCRKCAVDRFKRKSTLPEYEANLRQIYLHMSRGAKRRGFSWEINIDCFALLIKMDCFYCGSSPSNKYKRQYMNEEHYYAYNGLDRMNAQKGYMLDNIVPCCKVCNRAKSDMGFKEFIYWINKLTHHQDRKFKVPSNLIAKNTLQDSA